MEDGLTAVVGPNGSGKSNIADALRWVLGEQNPRALRCEKRMEELIFHGTETRSAVGFAEVSLCLDNTERGFSQDMDEILVTRRLYRSGESEYFMGKAACRLKDIQELLMDTGLGQDGYSIIGQGMLKRIISDKSGDRRNVFEEACGISRYRHRKEDAERKLANAQVNLLRVSDKIEELAPQAESLKGQAEKARSFLLLRDELRGHEINLWLDDWDRVKAAFTPLRDNLRLASQQSQQGQDALNELYAREETLESQTRDALLASEQARGELSRREEAAQSAESRLAVIGADVEHHEENIQRILADMEQSATRSGGLDAQIAGAGAERAGLMAELNGVQNEIAALQAKAEELAARSGDLDAQLGLLRLEEGRLREGLNLALLEQASFDAQRSEWDARRQTLDAEREGREAAISEAGAALAEAQTLRGAAAEKVAELDNVLGGYALRLQTRRKRADEARERLSALELEQARLSSRRHLLAEQERERQGFSNAVRAVLNEGFPFAHGTLTDLITVDDEYAVAIETALGPATQHIVVDTEEDAKTCVSLLKRRDAGRATFLPLSSVRGQEMEPLRNARGFIGVASGLVRVDGRYADILRSVLGRTAVVETLDDGIALARAGGYRYRIVTLDGQVLNAGGSITGGSVAKSTGLLARKNELAQLETGLKALTEKHDACKRDVSAAERELSGVVYEIETAEAERGAATEALAGLTADVQHRETALEGARIALDQLAGEQEQLEARLSEARTGREAWEGKHSALSASIADTQAKLQALGGGHEELSAQQRGVAAEAGALRERKAELSEAVAGRDRALLDLARLREEMSGDEQTRQAALDGYRAKKEDLLRQREELSGGRGEHRRLVEEQQDALRALYAQQQDIEQARGALSRAIKERTEENARLAQETARLENKITAGEAEERAIADRLWTSYELTYSSAAEVRTPMESRAKAQRRAAELKKAMTALGLPNLGAIEAYDEVAGRLELLTVQYDDAFKAKAELEKIIAGLTAEMTLLFAERFERINGQFQGTFRDIFGGGQAHLELLDPEDVLNCDIEIKSQPPGKKLRSISLLSGGETSLTAIALYFALFQVRPAPFCVLDEIDHDLDETNVERFARYLARLSGT
ncbi:MAG: chromosome segregation protein SMC, partial [Oscillospiraceae bacterium]|nr:chromosome segregation protein SMC [Oscillospiraceae bacterium]